MRKLVLFMHTSLDGLVAGPNGEMDWIKLENEIFDYADSRTEHADTALYGRITFEMMENYWPTAGSRPNASKHDIEHSRWYNRVEKVVLSKTLHAENYANTSIISKNVTEEITRLKHAAGHDILMFGSPTVAHLLMKADLIDDYWLLVNPVLLGKGIPLFTDINDKIDLNLVESKVFSSGVLCLHYERSLNQFIKV